MKYTEKLKDPRWQRKRLEILQRDGWACLCCGDMRSALQVHHKQYHGNPWDAPADSLETLCEKCHNNRSDVNKKFLSLSTGEAMAVSFIVMSGEMGYTLRSFFNLACHCLSGVVSKSDNNNADEFDFELKENILKIAIKLLDKAKEKADK